LAVHDDLELSSTSSLVMAMSGGSNPDESSEEAEDRLDSSSTSKRRTDKLEPLNSDEIRLGEVHFHGPPSSVPPECRLTKTKFLVPDKCLTRRLEVKRILTQAL